MQEAHRQLYHSNQFCSKEYHEKILYIIYDKMDHCKTASPHFSHKTKATNSFMKMLVVVIGMIAHGYGDIRYVHYGLDIFPTDSNHIVGSIAKLLRDLEGEPKNSLRTLFFEEEEQTSLTKAVLNGSPICLDSLLLPLAQAISTQSLLRTLTLQLDNASGDNNNRWIFAFCSMLVFKGIFHEVYINFLIVGYTHKDIDALFVHWSLILKTKDYPTIPRLIKSSMECGTHPIIPHFIEEVLNFKRFMHGYLGSGGNSLEGHSLGQQFKFYVDANGWPLMEYKFFCTDKDWLPENDKEIWLWSETKDGRPLMPSGDPPPLAPQYMKNLGEIKKGLDSFIVHWS